MTRFQFEMLKFLNLKDAGDTSNLREKFFFSISGNHIDYLDLIEQGYITGNENYVASITKEGKIALEERMK